MNKALFLDRDGVINRERGEYTWRVDDFELLPDLIPVLENAYKKDYLIIIISNQGGIAKGIYTYEDVEACHSKFINACNQSAIKITECFYSPDHPDFTMSLSRKPSSLMLEKAIARFNIDPGKSLMVGDKDIDVEAAEKAGVKGLKIESNSSLKQILPYLLS